MKKFFLLSLVFLSSCMTGVYAANSMFDDGGNYSGNWKQMTNMTVSKSSVNSTRHNSVTSYSVQNSSRTDTVPFRYNTRDYTRVRKVQGGYGHYSARCSDIGDVSFCH